MKHIRKATQHPQKKGKMFSTMCGAKRTPDDSLVDAALASDCDECRAEVGVGRKNEKTWAGVTLGVHPEPELDSAAEPMRDAKGEIFQRDKP